MNSHRLTSKQMAQFVASDYLCLDDMVPKDLCTACLQEKADHRGYLDVGSAL